MHRAQFEAIRRLVRKKEQVIAIASVQVVLSLPEIEPTEDEKLGLGGMRGT
jgi:hypothetical protein